MLFWGKVHGLILVSLDFLKVFSNTVSVSRWPRVVKKPKKGNGQVIFDLCSPEGRFLIFKILNSLKFRRFEGIGENITQTAQTFIQILPKAETGRILGIPKYRTIEKLKTTQLFYV